MKRLPAIVWPLFVYLGVAFAFAPEAMLGLGSFWHHDLRHHHLPWRVWAAGEWAQLQVPWWAPGAANGFPLLAEGQGGFLYLPTMALFLLFSGPVALNLSILGHQVLGALGMHLFLQARGARGWAPYVGGIAWSFCGFAISHTLYLGMQNGLAWLPWLCWATATGRWAGVALSIGALGLAGHPQAAAFGGLIAAIYAMNFPGRRLKWGAAALGGLLLASPQLLATLELSRFSLREGGVDPGFASIGRLPLPELINAVLPYFFGYDRPADVPESYYHRGPGYWGLGVNHWEMCFYLGFPLLVMAAIGWRRAPGWALAALLCLLLMVGGPLWELLRLLPGFDFFRFPVRFAMGLSLCIAVLATEGYGTVLQAQQRQRWTLHGWQRNILLLSACFFLATGIGHVVVREAEYPLRSLLRGHYWRQVDAPAPPLPASPLARAALPAIEPEDPSLIAQKVDRVIGSLLWSSAPSSPGVLWPLVSLLLSAACLTRPRWFPALIALDLWSFGRNYHPRVPMEEVAQAPAWLVDEMRQPGGGRMTVLDRRVAPELDAQLLSASLGLMYGTQDVILPSPLLMVRNDALLARAGLTFSEKGSIQVEHYLQNLEFARRIGLKYIVSIHEVPGLFPLVRGSVNVFLDPAALPRVRMVPCSKQVHTADDVFLAMDGLDPRKVAVYEGPEDGPVRCEEAAENSSANLLSYTSQRVEVEATGPGELLLSDSWYPRWQATIDGTPVEIRRADQIFRGIPIPAGSHRVVFSFDPGLPGVLLWGAMAGMFGISFGGLYGLWKQRGQRGAV